jgi:hypothetical protein
MKFELMVGLGVTGVGLLASPAHSQALSSVDRNGIKRMLVYGTDPCPPSAPGEIVICARRPDRDRYRIPERFREPDSLTGPNEAWAYKAERLEMVGAGGTLSCSPVGPGGSTGCMQQLINSARKERRADKKAEEQIP